MRDPRRAICGICKRKSIIDSCVTAKIYIVRLKYETFSWLNFFCIFDGQLSIFGLLTELMTEGPLAVLNITNQVELKECSNVSLNILHMIDAYLFLTKNNK